MDDERFWSDGMMDLPQARIADHVRELLIEGEWTAPDGTTKIMRGPRGDYRVNRAGHPATAMNVDDLPDFSSVYDAITGRNRPATAAASNFGAGPGDSHRDYKPCIEVECPTFEETTLRFSAVAVVPPWVSAALDRAQREWSDYLHRAHGKRAYLLQPYAGCADGQAEGGDHDRR